ncbi:MAG: Cobalamin-binding protein precursor [Methanocella sp. PtaU1.Bin125]|nr:MAG: Cobalamin-binding protein precursor [Methanocella sp. PtaU1.Bin125]
MLARDKIVFVLLAAVVVTVCGCSSTVTPSPAPEPMSLYPMTVSDYYDCTVTIAHAPERIVSLSPVNTEILFDLGAGGRIVGNTDYCDYPAGAKNITHVSGFNAISYEKIIAICPDLIVAEDIVSEEAIARLRETGIPLVELKNNNLSMIRENILLIGKITDTEANATALVAGIDRDVESIRSKTAGLNDSQKPTVLLLAGLTKKAIYPYGTGTYGDELLTLTGGRNVASGLTGYQVMSNEAIIKADPDFIVVPVNTPMCTMSAYENLKNGSEPWMKDLKAVRAGKVIAVEGSLFLRPGPRTPEAGLALARAIHPELFQ